MVSSVPLSALLTAVFVATGCLALARWAALWAGLSPHGDQVAELSHLTMSLAMVAMLWAYGGPAGSVVQIVAFTGFAGYFVDRLVRRRAFAGRHTCPAVEYHLMMSMTMIWMVAGMPVLMAGTRGAARGWAMALTVASVGALLTAAVFWAARAVRGRSARLVTVGASSHRVAAALNPRPEAVCHLAMSLGMATMFLAMV
ncbi:MAG: DUF5134 domain-containing protein [Pseudonocardia sp.]|nr:DUF5134 domain-containing protein [Pseudonocardia sp.]